MSDKKIKYAIGYWFEKEPRGYVEADSHEDADRLVREFMQGLLELDIYDLECEIDRYSFVEEDAWEDAPQGEDVEYYNISVSQDFWVKEVT